MFKKFLSALLLLSVLLLPVAALAGSPDESTSSVARVAAAFDGGYNLGSAFAVGQSGQPVEYFITNFHVVENTTDVYIFVGDARSRLHATIVKTWTSPDLAILRLDTPSTLWKPATLGSTANVKVSDRVYAIGFPGAADLSTARLSDSGSVTVTEGIVSSKDVDIDTAGSKALRISNNIDHGSSGGPLVNDSGIVVGVCVGGVDGFNYAINSDYVIHGLDELGIKYMNADNSSSSLVLILIVAAVALILIAVAVVVVLRSRRAQPVYAQSGETDHVYIAPPAPAKPRPMSATVTCIAGPMKGRSYKLSGTAVFGREAQCNVVFPKDTAGVGRRHCSLTITPSAITLTDLNSSNGTFIKNDERLTPGASCRLSRGDVFYLGSKNNGFMIG